MTAVFLILSLLVAPPTEQKKRDWKEAKIIDVKYVEKHDDFGLPPLSISMLRRLEQRGVYTPARYSGPNSPAHLSDDNIRAIRDHIHGRSLVT